MQRKSKAMHWIKCPRCNQLTHTHVTSDTVLLNFPLYCPRCRRETVINIVKLKMVTSEQMLY